MTTSGPVIQLRWWHHWVVFLLAFAVIVSRRPDALFHAQFWAEDGHVWYADAYNLGWWPALFRVFGGYVEVFPRLGAALALLVPLRSAPLVLNLLAIGTQALPANLLLSKRSSAWGSLTHRCLMAGMYLVFPNSRELNATVTNSQWFLGLIAFLILVARKPSGISERAFDLCALALCALSGPFCIFLLPIAAFLLWTDRDRWRWVGICILSAGCAVEILCLVNGGYSGRLYNSLGASPGLFVRLLAAQFYIGALLGPNGLAAKPGVGPLISLTGVTAAGSVLLVICLVRVSVEMRLLFAFSGMVLAASLKAPLLNSNLADSAWGIVALGGGTRYWYFPCLALAWSILWCFQRHYRVARYVSAALLCIFCFGVVLHWRNQAFIDMHFASYAKRFDAAPVGSALTIPVNPPGWNMQLIKHAVEY